EVLARQAVAVDVGPASRDAIAVELPIGPRQREAVVASEVGQAEGLLAPPNHHGSAGVEQPVARVALEMIVTVTRRPLEQGAGGRVAERQVRGPEVGRGGGEREQAALAGRLDAALLDLARG